MRNIKNSAFTLAEMIIALVAIGVLVVMTLKIVLKQTPDKEKALFKKVYTQLEMNVSELINDTELYPDDSGFANTLSIEDIEKGEIYGRGDTKKTALDSDYEDVIKYFDNYVDFVAPHVNENICKYKTPENIMYMTMWASIRLGQLATLIKKMLVIYPKDSLDYVEFEKQMEFLKVLESTADDCHTGSVIYTSDNIAKLQHIRRHTVDTVLAGYVAAGGIVVKSDFETNSKFRDTFKSKLNIFEDNLTCAVASNNSKNEILDVCFMADDGAVYGITNTDFESENVFSITQDGDTLAYAPITIYINWDKVKNRQNEPDIIDKEAIIVGVRFNGGMKLLNTVDCSNEAYKNYKQCQAIEYLKSNTIKGTKDK